MKPYDYQEADIADLLAHNATGFVVAETGGGKTLIAAETSVRSGVPTKLIIAPQGTHKDVWTSTILEQDLDARVNRIDGTPTGKAAMSDLEWKEPGYYLMTPQLFTRWKPLHLRPDLMIVDEAHLLGNRDSAGGKALRKMAGAAGHRMALSGTLYRNRFENAWNLLRFVYPERSYPGDIADIAPNRWIDTFCATKYDHFAPGNRVVVGELHPGDLASLVPCWRQHFKRAECCEFHPHGFLANLPEPIVIRETVQLTAGQKKAMRQMQSDYLAYLDLATEEWLRLPVEDRKRKALVTKMPVVRETRLSQMTLAMPSIIPRPAKMKNGSWQDVEFIDTEVDGLPFRQAADDRGIPLWDVIYAPDAESPKLDALIGIYHKLQEPIVAATNSQKFAALATARLNEGGIRAFEWSGDKPQHERDEAKARLQRGELDIIVGVTSAIGTGIDGLQDASGVLVRMNRDRDLSNETQLEGRLDRRGQKRQEGVVIYEIIAEGSTDEDVIDNQLQRRMDLNRSLRREVTNNSRRFTS